MSEMKVYNSKNEEIVLNDREAKMAAVNQRQVNALGYDIPITTLTTVLKKVVEQKYFEISPADYIPIRVGEGAWSQQLLTFRSFGLADNFETGIINTGGNNSRLASGDAGVDSVVIKINNWAKSIGWSLFDVEQAAKAGNWDIITAKEKARKKNWDLGIQKIAFLGIAGDSGINGLYTQAGVTTNTTLITKPIGSMTPDELKAFCAAVLNVYRQNNNRTAWPTHFVIPESDYLSLAAPSSAQFPLKSVLEVLEDTFKVMTHNPNFKILPNVYGDGAYNGLGKQVYVMYNADDESIRMDIPVDYTNTLANSIDNFSFQNVAYGQFTGVQAYRTAELLYFSFTL